MVEANPPQLEMCVLSIPVLTALYISNAEGKGGPGSVWAWSILHTLSQFAQVQVTLSR